MRRTPRRVALIGVSGYGKIYLERLRRHADAGDLRIEAATVINRPEEGPACAELEACGARLYGDFQEMLAAHAGRLDLVLVPTGIHWHAPMALAALAAGANVLVEKPLAATIQDVRALEAAAASRGRFIAVGFQDLYLAETHVVKRRLLEGRLGRVRRIVGCGLWPRSSAYYGRNDWAGRVRLDGAWVLDSPLANAFAHHLNLALFLAGESQTRSAKARWIEAELYRARPIESYDTAAVRVGLQGGAEICFCASHACAASAGPELRIEGESGRADWSPETGWRLSGPAGEERLPARSEWEAREAMFAAILRRLEEPGTFVAGPDISAEHVRCSNGAHAATPIHDLPASVVREVAGSDGGRQPVIADLERHFERAYASGGLLRESGCPWASPAGRISLENFATFPP